MSEAAFIYLFNLPYPIGPVPSLTGTQCVNCRESTGTGLVVLNVVFLMGAVLAGPTMDQLMSVAIFSTPPFGGHVESIDRLLYQKRHSCRLLCLISRLMRWY